MRALWLRVTLPPGLSVHIDSMWPITLAFQWKREKSCLWVRTGQLPWLLKYICFPISPVIDSLFHSNFFFVVLHNSFSHFQALQKICLASHIRSMAELLHVGIIQQLEVTLLGSPSAQVIDLLIGGWVQTKPVPMTTLI